MKRINDVGYVKSPIFVCIVEMHVNYDFCIKPCISKYFSVSIWLFKLSLEFSACRYEDPVVMILFFNHDLIVISDFDGWLYNKIFIIHSFNTALLR